jgi:Leucine-rich repeat (LRR) protein
MTQKSNPTPRLLPFAEADAALDGGLSSVFQGRYKSVLLFDGDLTLEGDFLPSIKAITDACPDVIAISGDLTVNGEIALYESRPGLSVDGFTKAETLKGGYCEIYIDGGAFTYLVHGYYNDGILETGQIEVPWVINDNHDLRVSAPNALRIDNYGLHDGEADFDGANIPEAFVAELLSTNYNNSVDVSLFVDRLRAGLPVLRPGARTRTQSALAKVEAAAVAEAPELDLSSWKLKSFPPGVLAMPSLKRLILDGNPIKELPTEIGTLTGLEHLSVVCCDLAALPDSIGALSKLRVLRIGSNGSFSFGETSPEIIYRPVGVPDSIGSLVNIEELDVSELSRKPGGPDLPEISVFALPDAACRLRKLKRILANQTNLVIPPSMLGLPSVEEISMKGASWAYLRKFPEAVTTFPNLKKLDLSSNFFDCIPDSLCALTSLEELSLDDALGLVARPLPDLSPLGRLRTLSLSGQTDHMRVPVPSHDLLRPLFAMDLRSLENLSIDRWGAEKKGGRGPLTADVIAGVGSFRTLRTLDLSFNDLTSLPDDFYTLPALESINLAYNKLDDATRQRLAAAFPQAKIRYDFRYD